MIGREGKAVTWNRNDIETYYTDSKKCYSLSGRQVVALLVTLRQMAWKTRWDTDDREWISNFVGDLSYALQVPVACGGSVKVCEFPSLPDCIELLDCDGDGIIDTFNFLECCMTYNFNFGCGCGCGNKSADSSVGGIQEPTPGIPGSSAGNVGWGNFSTICDFSNVIDDYILPSVNSVMDNIANTSIPAAALEFFGGAWWDATIGTVQESAAAISSELSDANYIDKLKQSAFRYFPDPVQPFTRSNLFGWILQTPYLSDLAPMQAGLMVWAAVTDIDLLNLRLQQAAGTGLATDCASFYASAGRKAFNPGSDTASYSFEYQDNVWQRYIVDKTVSSAALNGEALLTLPDDILDWQGFVLLYTTNIQSNPNQLAISYAADVIGADPAGRLMTAANLPGDTGNKYVVDAPVAIVDDLLLSGDPTFNASFSGYTLRSTPSVGTPAQLGNNLRDLRFAVTISNSSTLECTVEEIWVGRAI